MKLLLDVQCLREIAPRTGIERYSKELAGAIARNAGDHVVSVLTAAGSVETARRIFSRWIPRERVLGFHAPVPVIEDSLSRAPKVRAAEIIREAFIAEQSPDLVHVLSLFEGSWDDVVTSIGAFEGGCRTCVTEYDLIPMLYPETYLPTDGARAWYQKKIQWLQKADLLLAISEHSKRQVVDLLGLPGERIVVIPGAADRRFHPLEDLTEAKSILRRRYGIENPFLLSVNAEDPRKNMIKLVQAFAQLPHEIRAVRQLVLVGRTSESFRGELNRIAKLSGLSERDVVLTGFAPDADLQLLYCCCELFVFPSLHEGLGLPILEAMACGVPVIGSNNSSIPEVIGRADALFDAEHVESIASKLCEVLGDPGFMKSLQRWGVEQAGRFDWDRSGRLAWDAFMELSRAPARSGREVAHTGRAKPRLAWVFIGAPGEAPTSQAYRELLRHLSAWYEVTVIWSCGTNREAAGRSDARDLEWFEAHATSYDRVVYDIADGHDAETITRLLEQRAGVVVLRDRAIRDLSIQQGTAISRQVRQTLYLEHGIAAVREQARDGAKRFSGLVRLVQAAIGVIVCSVEARQAVGCGLSPGLARFIEMAPALGDVDWAARQPEADAAAAADGLRSSIDTLYRSHPNATLDRAINQIGSLSGELSDDDMESVAKSVFVNRSFLQPRVLLDGGLLVHGGKGGISRVARNLVDHLTRSSRPGLRVELFQSDQAGLRTCSAAWKRLGVPEFDWTDVPIEPTHTDRVISLEFSLSADIISALKQRNVGMYFVVYDLLPSRHPDFFTEGSFRDFEAWLERAVLNADGIICISQTVAHDLREWLIERNIPRKTPLQISWSHLGADFAGDGGLDLSPQEDQLVRRALAQPLAIMVGSLEYRSDRKGYGQALDAFQLLWARGYQGNLAFVGQRVSASDELTGRIANHPEFGKRLFWFESPTDPVLTELYRSATVLLYPSHGEGFGLPLAEAAWHDLPVIARDLPVFREIAGPHVMYFDGFGGSDLAAAVERFWQRRTLNDVPSSARMKPLNWAQSAEQFLSIVLNGDWRMSYGPTV